MPSNPEWIHMMKIEGLPMLTGQLDLEARRRAQQLEEFPEDYLAYALVERERQLAQAIQKLRERS